MVGGDDPFCLKFWVKLILLVGKMPIFSRRRYSLVVP